MLHFCMNWTLATPIGPRSAALPRPFFTRALAPPAPSLSGSRREGYKLSHFATRMLFALFSYGYKLPIFYPLSFDIHASDGGCRGHIRVFSSNLEPPTLNFCLFIFFRTLLRSHKSQLPCFQAIPNSLAKIPGGGVPPGSALLEMGACCLLPLFTGHWSLITVLQSPAVS
jgi:hypothetical protein